MCFQPSANISYAGSEDKLMRLSPPARGGRRNDDMVKRVLKSVECSGFGYVEIEWVNAELCQAVVLLVGPADTGDAVAKRDQPLAKRFADVTATDD